MENFDTKCPSLNASQRRCVNDAMSDRGGKNKKKSIHKNTKPAAKNETVKTWEFDAAQPVVCDFCGRVLQRNRITGELPAKCRCGTSVEDPAYGLDSISCPGCGGSGRSYYNETKPCQICHGKGRLTQREYDARFRGWAEK